MGGRKGKEDAPQPGRAFYPTRIVTVFCIGRVCQITLKVYLKSLVTSIGNGHPSSSITVAERQVGFLFARYLAEHKEGRALRNNTSCEDSNEGEEVGKDEQALLCPPEPRVDSRRASVNLGRDLTKFVPVLDGWHLGS